MSKKRIGILTSGGDCPGLNAVIRGAVKASHQLGYDCVGFLKGYEGLFDPVQYKQLTPSSTSGILSQGGTILGSTNKGRFAATVGLQDRVEIAPHLIEGVKQTIEQLGIDGLICVGGDGSLAVAQQFHENGINVVGVPKTIDNDLSATAFTFGFDSAIECATDALDRLHTTAASHERIMVLEVMGRHAGWIALHAGIAGGGDVILIPEVEWSYEHVCHKILHRESLGKRFTLVVVAEGAELPDGELVGEQREGQQMKLGGVGRTVAAEIERRLHRETRLSVLGHLQRGGKPTTFDRVLATQFGAHAVRLIKEGRFGEMICSRPPEMTSVPIIEAVNVLRRVDPHGPAVQAARALGISFGDRSADEIGHDVFCREEAAAFAAGPVEEPHFDEHSLGDDLERHDAEPAVVATVDEPIEQPAAEIVEEVAEVEQVLPIDETPSPEPVEPPVETAAEQNSTEDQEAEPLVAEQVAEEPADQEEEESIAPAEETTVEQPLALDAEAEPERTPEDEAVEEVAEAVLDMLDEADAAANGPLEEESEEEPAEELPETDVAEAVTALEQPVEKVAEEPEQPAEEPTKAEATTAKEGADDSLSEAQSLLAQRIAAAAKEKRDEATEATVDAEVGSIDVAELVKQKLASVSVGTPPTEAAEPVDDTAEEAAVADEESQQDEKAKPKATLAEPADAAVDDELVAQARAALEAALSE